MSETVAEQPLRCGVPAGDDPIQVLRQNGVIRGFDDRREMLRSIVRPRRSSVRIIVHRRRSDGTEIDFINATHLSSSSLNWTSSV
jgi:hypothetical protein